MTRLQDHRTVSAALARLDDDHLAARVEDAPVDSVGIGGAAARIDVDGVPVFIKRIALTDLELAHPRSTANLFDVPPSFASRTWVWRRLSASLSPPPSAFAADHVDHDAAYALMRLVNWLVTHVCGIGGPESGGPAGRNAYKQ